MGSQEARQGAPARGVELSDETIDERSGRPEAGVEGTMAWKTGDAGQSGDVEPAAPAADRIIAGRYRLGTLLGSGGMGSVWLTEDAVLQRAVALKQLKNQDREDRPAALQEARAAARITHAGVVRVYDAVREDDEDWIVMEALSGEPLSAIIRARGRLPVDEVRQMAVQLLSGLRAIHAADLVHRDIEPGNVQVCGDGRVVITDFRLSSPGGAWGGLRVGVGALAGSPTYMPPRRPSTASSRPHRISTHSA